jgi:hypothetical protein
MLLGLVGWISDRGRPLARQQTGLGTHRTGLDRAGLATSALVVGVVPVLWGWGQIAARLWVRSQTDSALGHAVVLDLVFSGLSVVAAVLAILVVYEITDRQRRRAYLRATTEPPPSSVPASTEPSAVSMSSHEIDERPGTRWLWWSLLPLGLGAWVPLFAGVRGRRPLWYALGGLWCLMAIVGWAMDIAFYRHTTRAGLGALLMIVAWLGAPTTSVAIRSRYVHAVSTNSSVPTSGPVTEPGARRPA